MVKAGVVTPDEPGVPGTYLVGVIESPARIYSQGTVTSILHLARCVGRYQERYSDHTVRLVEPREWKGTIDGDIMAARIKATLSADTRDKLPKMTKSVEHNMLDAIGLGQWSLRQPGPHTQRRDLDFDHFIGEHGTAAPGDIELPVARVDPGVKSPSTAPGDMCQVTPKSSDVRIRDSVVFQVCGWGRHESAHRR